MKLNSKQVDHLLQRIAAIAAQKRKAKIAALGKPVEHPESAMTNDTKYAQIASGKAVLKPFGQCKGYHSFNDLDQCFTYHISAKSLAEFEEYETTVERIDNAVRDAEQSIIDKLMLSGDADEALKLLQEFEKSST